MFVITFNRLLNVFFSFCKLLNLSTMHFPCCNFSTNRALVMTRTKEQMNANKAPANAPYPDFEFETRRTRDVAFISSIRTL